jgi:hypothetical protein
MAEDDTWRSLFALGRERDLSLISSFFFNGHFFLKEKEKKEHPPSWDCSPLISFGTLSKDKLTSRINHNK